MLSEDKMYYHDVSTQINQVAIASLVINDDDTRDLPARVLNGEIQGARFELSTSGSQE